MTTGRSLQKPQVGSEVRRPEPTQAVYYTPACDIVETPEELLLFAEMPGVKPEDVDIRYENGELHVYGRRAAQQEKKNYLLEEYEAGDFYRAFTVGETLDADRISAELKNGVLTVHLPKHEALKPRKIAVKGGESA